MSRFLRFLSCLFLAFGVIAAQSGRNASSCEQSNKANRGWGNNIRVRKTCWNKVKNTCDNIWLEKQGCPRLVELICRFKYRSSSKVLGPGFPLGALFDAAGAMYLFSEKAIHIWLFQKTHSTQSAPHHLPKHMTKHFCTKNALSRNFCDILQFSAQSQIMHRKPRLGCTEAAYL